MDSIHPLYVVWHWRCCGNIWVAVALVFGFVVALALVIVALVSALALMFVALLAPLPGPCYYLHIRTPPIQTTTLITTPAPLLCRLDNRLVDSARVVYEAGSM